MRRGSSTNRTPGHWLATALLVCGVGAALLVGGVGAAVLGGGQGVGLASAGDTVTIVEFEPNETDVEAGQTVELDVVMRTDGGKDDVPVENATIRIDYPTAHVDVIEVEPGPWFYQEDSDADVRTTAWIDDDAGVAGLRQVVRDRDDAVVGEDRIATVALEIAEDAPERTLVLEADESRVTYVATDYPAPVIADTAELHVDGGGDRVDPSVDEDYAFDPDDEVTATSSSTSTEAETGGDGDADTADAGSAGDSDGDSDGETPEEAPAPIGAVAVGVLLAAFLFRRR